MLALSYNMTVMTVEKGIELEAEQLTDLQTTNFLFCTMRMIGFGTRMTIALSIMMRTSTVSASPCSRHTTPYQQQGNIQAGS